MKKPDTSQVIIALGQNTQIRLDTLTGCYRAMTRQGWQWSQVCPATLGEPFVTLADNLAYTLKQVKP